MDINPIFESKRQLIMKNIFNVLDIIVCSSFQVGVKELKDHLNRC